MILYKVSSDKTQSKGSCTSGQVIKLSTENKGLLKESNTFTQKRRGEIPESNVPITEKRVGHNENESRKREVKTREPTKVSKGITVILDERGIHTILSLK